MKFFVAAFACFSLAFAQQTGCPNVGEKSQNPVLVTTTVTTITDLNTGMSRSFQSVYPGSGENPYYPSSSGFESGSFGSGSGSQSGWGTHGTSGSYPSGGYSNYQSGSEYRGGYGSGHGGMDYNQGDKYSGSSWMRPFPYGPRRPVGTGQQSHIRSMMEIFGIPGVLNENDVRLLNASWNILKRRPDFAPKVFIRYFKMKPEAQKYFPEIANVPVNDLPNNRDFLFRVYTCFNSLNLIIPHLTAAFPENYPAFINLKNKYNAVDLKRFGSIYMTAMQEELGNDFTPEVREAWKKTIMAITNYASQSDQSGNPNVAPGVAPGVTPGQQPTH